MKNLYRLIFLSFLILILKPCSAYSLGIANKDKITKTVASPFGQITGNATVCLNATAPLITFEVKDDNGKGPYTFIYTINNIAQPPIKTTGNNTSVTVSAPTNVTGTFTYDLTGVKDKDNNNVDVSSSIDKVIIKVNLLPVVDFTSNWNSNTCSDSPIQFNSNVTIGTSPYKYAWDFGDSTTSTDQNPMHSFKSLGCGTAPFTVKLTVTDANGCVSVQASHVVTIKQKPDIDFTDLNNPFDPFNNCSGATLNPVYSIKVGNANTTSSCITSFSINWGDGNSQPNISFPITHTYNSLGAYSMVITANGSNGCVSTKTYIIKNVSNPLGGLNSPGSTQNLCAPTPNLQFSISNWGSNSLDTTYSIDYGDSSTLLLTQNQLNSSSYYNSANPSSSNNYPIPHIYITSSCPAASFEVKLIVTNACGPTPFTLGNISILTKPVANFTAPANACVNKSVLFTNTTVSGYGLNCAQSSIYTWDFGDGSPKVITPLSPPQNINHTYTTFGTYTVSLSVQNGCGTTTKTQQICIEPPLVPVFTLNTTSGCAPLSVKTTNTTNLVGSCTTPTYLWTVDYSSSNCGTTSSYTLLNGTTLTSFAPEFNFINSGTYTFKLTATNSCGSVSSSSQTVVVKKPPTVSINTISSLCQTFPTTLISPKATVTNCGSQLETYAWSFPGGTPAISTTANPGSIAYSSSGTYTASLIVTNECGQTIATDKTFSINTAPVLTNTPLTQTICSGFQTALVNLTSNSVGTTFSWTATATSGITGFTTTGTSTIPVQTILTSIASSGTITYAITPSLGSCSGTVTNYVITVNPAPTITGQPSSSTVCQGGTPTPLSVTFTSSTGTPQYQWYSNTLNNTTSGTAIVNGTNSSYSPPASIAGITYYYCIITLSSGGCSNIKTNTAKVEVAPLVTISSQPTTTQSLCVGSTIASPLTVTYTGGTGTVTYQWFSNTINSNTGGTLINGATNTTYTPPIYNIPNTFYYYVVVTSSVSGCGSITSNVSEVIVSADPVFSAQPLAIQTICQGTTATNLKVVVTGGLGAFSYKWYSNTTANATGGTLVGTNSDTYTPLTNTVGILYYYCIISQPGLGCEVTSTIAKVTVVAAPSITTQPQSSIICVGGTPTSLTVTYTNGVGTPSYQWYFNIIDANTGGTAVSGATNVNFSPPNSPVGTTYYYCIITLPSSGGCSSISSNQAGVTINSLPTIDTQPLTTQSICVGGTIPALTVSYKDGVGTPTYQWYSNTSNSTSGGTAVGGNSASYTPPLFTTVGTFYYYALVSLSGSGCGTAISNPAQVIVVADPSVSTQPLADQTLCQGSAPANLAVVATGGLGTFSYQWYSNTNSTTIGGTPVGTNLDTYTPLTNTVGILYYYCVISQPGLGCQVTSAFAKVTIVAAPVINNQPQSSSICIGGAPSSLSVTYSNGTGTASYQWYDDNGAIAGATNINYTPIITATTNYYCIITFSSGGCTSITSSRATVTVYPLPTIDVQPLATQNICVGGTISALTVSYKDGVGTPTYQWYSNTTNSTSGGTAVRGNSSSYTPPIFTTVGTFYYYVVVSLGGNGCGKVTSNPSEIIVVGDPIITSQPLPSQTLCQGSAPTTLSVVASGGIGAYSYQWFSNTPPGTLISGATTDTFIPNTTTVGVTKYYCVISQPNLGCEVKSAFAEVIIVPSPIITTQPQSSSVCEGGTPTPLTVAYINGTGTTTYQWFRNTINSIVGGTPISGATAMTFNPPANLVGTVYYYCEVRFSSGGCTVISSDTAEVNVFQIPVIVNQKLVVCSGDVLNFIPQQGNGNTVPANTMYSWTLTSITPLGAISGATNAIIPQSSFTQTLINSTNQVATALYTVTPKAAICSGNPFTIEVQVYPKPEVVFSSPNQIICNETSSSIVTLTSSTPGTITFSWTASVPSGITGAILSGTNSIPIQNLVNTTNLPLTVNYSAIGTFNYNGAGCSGATSIYSITVNPTIVTSSIISNHNGYGVSYFGGLDGSIDLTVTGGSGNYTYIWSGPNGFSALTQDISGVAAGTYTVSINDGYCAPVILTFILTQPPELLFQEDLAAHVNLICYGASNGSLGITITQESVSPYDFNVVGSNGTIVSTIMNSANLNQLFTGLPSDIYSVVITDGNGGVKTLNGIHITQPDEIVITAATTPIICYGGNDASITITVSGGTAPYKGQWDNLALGFYQNNLSSGDYTITVTDANNCTKTLKVNIPDPPIFTIYPVVKNISCFGAHDGSINLNIVGGIAPVALVWSDNPMIGNVRNNLGPGIYTVTISDGKPCYITKSFTIVEPQPLVLASNTTHALDCSDANSGAINLMVSGGTPPFSYAWSNGATTEDLAAISAGNYLVTVTDSRGCAKTAQYIITRPSPLVANVQTDTEFNCETRYVKQTFVAQVSGGVPPYQLFWSSGTVSGANNQFMNTTQNGLVVLKAIDALGCSTNYTFNVTNPTLGTSTFTTGSIGYSTYGIFSIIDPIQFTTNATGDFISVSWNFGDGSFSNEENPLHTYVKEGNYVVKQTVTYPFGCVYTHIITLIVTKGYELIMPTAFTPNMDGINDTIKPVYRGLKSVQIDIYDTWGELIYSEKGDVLKGWDGKIKDVESENGNYYCKVSGETFYGTTVYKNTPFVLIK